MLCDTKWHSNVGTGSRSFFWFVLQKVNRGAYNISSCFCCRTMDGALSFLSSTDMTHHLCLLQYNTCTSLMHFINLNVVFVTFFLFRYYNTSLKFYRSWSDFSNSSGFFPQHCWTEHVLEPYQALFSVLVWVDAWSGLKCW